MIYCPNCGKSLKDNAKFCDKCGTKIEMKKALGEENKDNSVVFQETKKEKTNERIINKCPHCGGEIESLSSTCVWCGFEMVNENSKKTVSIFVEKLRTIIDEAKKIEYIKSYPIPNDKQSIMEFMVLACTNFDEEYHAKHLDDDDISDAWWILIEKCYKQSKYVLSNSEDINKVEEMYQSALSSKSNAIKKAKKKKLYLLIFVLSVFFILLILGLAIPEGEALLGIAFLELVVSMVIIFGKKTNEKNSVDEKNGNINNQLSSSSNSGYKSWHPFVKVLWILLNIYLFGIPLIIYLCVRKNN